MSMSTDQQKGACNEQEWLFIPIAIRQCLPTLYTSQAHLL